VAAGRRMSVEQVHELARGRVWTGADAIANGLADEIGGLREAEAIARKRAGLPTDAPVRVYPRLGPFDQLRPVESSEARPAARAQLTAGSLGMAAAGAVGAGALAALFADGWGPAWRFAAAAGLPPYGPLTLPGSWTIS
jgi:protease IV